MAYDGTGVPNVLLKIVTGLTLDADYTFWVTGLNPDEGAVSDSLSVRAAGKPTAPGAITEVASTRTGSQIGLTWVAPSATGGSAITAYQLVRVQNNVDDIVKYYGSSTSTTVTGLSAGTEYTFKVVAINLVGEGTYSSEYKFLIVDVPTPPLNLAVSSYTNVQIVLTWEMPLFNGGQAITGFKVYRRALSDSTAEHSLLTTVSASTFTYTDSAVTGGAEYSYYVVAYNTLGGDSEPSTHV